VKFPGGQLPYLSIWTQEKVFNLFIGYITKLKILCAFSSSRRTVV
jgi:hypothetical protein